MRLVSEGLLRDKEVLLGEGMRRDNGLKRSTVRIIRAFSHEDKGNRAFPIDISIGSARICPIRNNGAKKMLR